MIPQGYADSDLTPNEKSKYTRFKYILSKLKKNKLWIFKIIPRHLKAFFVYHLFLKNNKDIKVGYFKSISYFYGLYNCTPLNERCLEIALGEQFINKSALPILEIGNVLKRYIKTNKLITIDKYEKYPNVYNYDFKSFKKYKKLLPEKFNLISLSTFEHIGWDEKMDKNAFIKIFSTLKELKIFGLNSVLISLPLGWNPSVDYYLAYKIIPKNYNITYFVKINFRWKISYDYPRSFSYDFKNKSARAIAIITKGL